MIISEEGKIDEGLLHILLKHSKEFRPYIPQLSFNFMASKDLIKMEEYVRAWNNGDKKAKEEVMLLYSRYHEKLDELEEILFQWMENQLYKHSHCQPVSLPEKYQRYYFELSGGKYLVIALSKQICPYAKKHCRKLITAFMKYKKHK